MSATEPGLSDRLTALLGTPGVSFRSFRVACALLTFGGHRGRAWPSVTTLAERARLPRRHVYQALRDLREAGLITPVGTRQRGVVEYAIVASTPDQIGQVSNRSPLTKSVSSTPDRIGHTTPDQIGHPNRIEEDLKRSCTADAAPPSKSKTKKKPSTHPQRAAVMDAWQTAWLDVTGKKPDWNAPKMRALANTIAGKGSIEEIRSRLAVWSSRRPEWAWKDGPPSLGWVASNWDSLVDTDAARAGDVLFGLRRLG